MTNLVFGVQKNLSSLSQLLARFSVINRWEGIGFLSGALLISKELITPVLPHQHPGWGWCQSLQDPSTLESHYTRLCTACLTSSYPADSTPAGLAEVARGLSAPSLLQVESRGSASTPSIPLPCSIKGNQGCNHIQSGPSSSQNSLKTFGLGAFYLFLFVLIPFNTLHSLSPNRE